RRRLMPIRMNKRNFRLMALLIGVALLALCFVHREDKRPPPRLVRRPPAEVTGDLFTNTAVPHLRIEVSPEGMAMLRRYHWEWARNTESRTNVLATVREGTTTYTNVALHLKGAAGSFRPVDDNPALTLNFDKFAPGQRFHGLTKIHLNNSVQDPSYICEQINREVVLAGGVPPPPGPPTPGARRGRGLCLRV